MFNWKGRKKEIKSTLGMGFLFAMQMKRAASGVWHYPHPFLCVSLKADHYLPQRAGEQRTCGCSGWAGRGALWAFDVFMQCCYQYQPPTRGRSNQSKPTHVPICLCVNPGACLCLPEWCMQIRLQLSLAGPWLLNLTADWWLCRTLRQTLPWWCKLLEE